MRRLRGRTQRCLPLLRYKNTQLGYVRWQSFPIMLQILDQIGP
jgi:hypothetical protein